MGVASVTEAWPLKEMSALSLCASVLVLDKSIFVSLYLSIKGGVASVTARNILGLHFRGSNDLENYKTAALRRKRKSLLV